MLTSEQVAAMMPTATHAAGSVRGFYLGHTLSGSRRPVLLNLREGSDSDRNTTVLCVGALGTGKTTLAQKLLYEGFLQGARVIDCDPKGDHRFHLLDDVAGHVQSVTLRPDPTLRGMLDPLRVAPLPLRQDAAVSFLRDLLPGGAEPTWETAIVSAVDRVVSRAAEPTCGEVVRALADGDDCDSRVGTALQVYARSGLTQLGFAEPGRPLPAIGAARVTYLPIAGSGRPGSAKPSCVRPERAYTCRAAPTRVSQSSPSARARTTSPHVGSAARLTTRSTALTIAVSHVGSAPPGSRSRRNETAASWRSGSGATRSGSSIPRSVGSARNVTLWTCPATSSSRWKR